MSRNPIAAYTHRGGFKMGQVEFKDFLWEALLDPAADVTMGDTAERTAREYKITREEVDRFAELSFSRAVAAQKACFLSGEIVPIVSEEFRLEGYKSRGIQLPKGVDKLAADTHIRPSTYEALAKIRPAFGGVQTGGNSSAIVDGAAAALIASGDYAKSRTGKPLARVAAVATVGVPPEIMSHWSGASDSKTSRRSWSCTRRRQSFRNQRGFCRTGDGRRTRAKARSQQAQRKWRTIAIGDPLAATGVRLAVTLARELQRSQKKYGVASACIGGGQGIAVLLENPNQKNDARRNSPLKSGAEINFKRRPIKRLLIHRAGMQEFQLGVMQSDVRG